MGRHTVLGKGYLGEEKMKSTYGTFSMCVFKRTENDGRKEKVVGQEWGRGQEKEMERSTPQRVCPPR